jgi:hypothetical protein
MAGIKGMFSMSHRNIQCLHLQGIAFSRHAKNNCIRPYGVCSCRWHLCVPVVNISCWRTVFCGACTSGQYAVLIMLLISWAACSCHSC